MIIWLNGAFGSGKTATARELEATWANARIFDPEWVGYALAQNLTDHEFADFQDLDPWRPLVVETIDRVIRYTEQNVVVVQTVLSEDYWREIRDGLEEKGHRVYHVALDADAETLARRIEDDDRERDAVAWRLARLPDYVEARGWMTEEADLVVDTVHERVGEVAARIIAAAGVRPVRRRA